MTNLIDIPRHSVYKTRYQKYEKYATYRLFHFDYENIFKGVVKEPKI